MRGTNQFSGKFALLASDDLSSISDVNRSMLAMASEGKSYSEIGEALDFQLGTVKSRLSRIRAKIISARQVKTDDAEQIAQL